MLSRRTMAAVLVPAAILLVGACAPKGEAAVPYDLLFIDAMVEHHNGAIEMAKPAESNALHPEMKEFARKVIEDQSGEVAMMTGWRDEWFAGKPHAPGTMKVPGMSMSMKNTDIDHLQSVKGAEFDLAFIDMMIPHHQGAVAMAVAALTRSERPEVRTLAQRIIDAQKAEVAMMEGWKAEWRRPE